MIHHETFSLFINNFQNLSQFVKISFKLSSKICIFLKLKFENKYIILTCLHSFKMLSLICEQEILKSMSNFSECLFRNERTLSK
jgi:hypothetical protein